MIVITSIVMIILTIMIIIQHANDVEMRLQGLAWLAYSLSLFHFILL